MKCVLCESSQNWQTNKDNKLERRKQNKEISMSLVILAILEKYFLLNSLKSINKWFRFLIRFLIKRMESRINQLMSILNF